MIWFIWFVVFVVYCVVGLFLTVQTMRRFGDICVDDLLFVAFFTAAWPLFIPILGLILLLDKHGTKIIFKRKQ